VTTFAQIIEGAHQNKYSDVHLKDGVGIFHRKGGRIFRNVDHDVAPEDIGDMIWGTLDEIRQQSLAKRRKADYALQINPDVRVRGSAFYQRKALSGVYRLVPTKIPSAAELGLPTIAREFALRPRGLVLIVGPAGSGKTTTAVSLVNEINASVSKHIVTVEDPIEYLLRNEKSIVTQRELDSHVVSFEMALKASLREDPDVVFIGEIRDLDTVSTAITMAETGHLVISTVQTIGACEVMDRIVNMFPSALHEQIRTQLSLNIQGIISQILLPMGDKSLQMTAAFEILNPTFALRALIRKGEVSKIKATLETSVRDGCLPMRMAVLQLHRQNVITDATRDKVFEYMR